LAVLGAHVVLTDVNDEAGTDAASSISRCGARAYFRHHDVRDPAELVIVMDAVVGDLGRLDILVNNAAVTKRIDMLDITSEDWDWIAGTNFRGLFFSMQAAVPHMIAAGGGRIVNVSSVAGKGFRETSNAVYASTKAGIIGLTRTAAAQLGRWNININAVCPGATETAFMRAWLEQRAAAEGRSVDEIQVGITSVTALGRTNSSADAAMAVAFLASPAARNITGQSLNIDAGLMWDLADGPAHRVTGLHVCFITICSMPGAWLLQTLAFWSLIRSN
jgi:NAD(P)-dependent dehydrogenase (short-subunit alcohol dehydrogenase family)